MRRKTLNAINTIALGWCGAFMIVLGSFLPPMIEAPDPPGIGILEVGKP